MQLNVITLAENAAAAPALEKAATRRLSSFQKIKAVNDRVFVAHRLLWLVWIIVGLVPLGLQARSYAKFVKPHKLPPALVISPDTQKEVANVTVLCPVEGFVLAGIWWNLEATHYYRTDDGIVCHSIIPQYNIHGKYWIGNTTTTPYHGTPSACANDSLPYHAYMYHGSIGFYSFFDDIVGTYCTEDNMAYTYAHALGTFDINGVLLANDMGGVEPRVSFWYGVVGGLWLVYRGLTIRRSYLVCRRYGQKCTEMGVGINQKEAMIFVQESLRLSAHGSRNYHRAALLYLIVEGIMTDLFLIIASDGWTTRIQYLSLGYNLSGLMLLMFEMVESMNWLSDKWRQRVKRSFFSYETTFVGEFVSALVFQILMSGLNGSDLKRSKPTALCVSYYFWSFISHGAIVQIVLGLISVVRVMAAVIYVALTHRTLAVLTESCCVDSTLGPRSRLAMLGGYRWEHGRLYYKVTALKAFGMLKMEEDDVSYLVIQKLHWFTAPRNNLVAIGVISGQRVEPCKETICTGPIGFLHRKLGGALDQVDIFGLARLDRPLVQKMLRFRHVEALKCYHGSKVLREVVES